MAEHFEIASFSYAHKSKGCLLTSVVILHRAQSFNRHLILFSAKELSLNETDETDVNALRTTEVNYLNNTDALPNRTTATKSILDQPPARWTHVNVNVPGVASSTVPSDSTTAHHSTFTKKEKQKKQIKYALRKNKDLVKNGKSDNPCM